MRKGVKRTELEWLQRLQSYVTDWETASTRIWDESLGFDLGLYRDYLARYMTGTQTRITQHAHPEVIPAPASWETYPSYDITGSRQHAVISILFTLCVLLFKKYYTLPIY